MAKVTRITSRTKVGSPLTKRLREMGCVFCPKCFAFMWPDHSHHIAMALDWAPARYVVVGGYGSTRIVDTQEEMAA